MNLAYLHSRAGRLSCGPILNPSRPVAEPDLLSGFAGVRCVGKSDIAATDPRYYQSMLDAKASNWLPAAALLSCGAKFDAVVAESEWLGIPAILFGASEEDHTPVYVLSDGLILDCPEALECIRGLSTARFLCASGAIRDRLIDAGVAPTNVTDVGWFLDCEFFAPQPEVDTAGFSALCLDCDGADLETAAAALDGLPVKVFLLSLANRQTLAARFQTGSIPPFIEVVQPKSWLSIREAYSRASIVIASLTSGRRVTAASVMARAMAMGKPTIATLTEGSTGMLDDGVTGHYVRPWEPQDIRSRVLQLLGDRDHREKMGCRAREQAVLRFSRNRHQRRLQEALA